MKKLAFGLAATIAGASASSAATPTDFNLTFDSGSASIGYEHTGVPSGFGNSDLLQYTQVGPLIFTGSTYSGVGVGNGYLESFEEGYGFMIRSQDSAFDLTSLDMWDPNSTGFSLRIFVYDWDHTPALTLQFTPPPADQIIFINPSAVQTTYNVDIRNAGAVIFTRGIGITRFDNLVGVAGVPEPATWAMFISGFGLIGGATRRRQKVTVTFA